jgi:ABC-type glycerol-3-phosphate transport system substrate-binding protein
MNKFKKLLCLGLTSLLATSTIACTTTSGTTSKEESKESVVESVESVVESESTAKTGTVELAVLEAGFGRTPYLELAKAYMAKNPSVQVKIRFSGFREDVARRTLLCKIPSRFLSGLWHPTDT